jgi:ABC-type lipoprotein release transport system permease subunit
MKMILEIAWKNIWRTKRRSLAVIGAIAVGAWALIFLFSFLNSFNDTYVNNAIAFEYSHLQIHHPDYRSQPELRHFIKPQIELERILQKESEVQAYSMRTIVNGMIASSKATHGIQVYGIHPEQEGAVTSLDQLLIEGSYFDGIRRNPILVSIKTADKLNLTLRSKVVLTFQDKDLNITAAAFRVAGIFDSKSPRINEGIVYVRQQDIQPLINLDAVHEVGILLEQTEHIPHVRNVLESDQYLVESFMEISPEFNLLKEQSTISKQVLTFIIMLALLFGIINTMLMAVLERTREIGMLRAIGMSRSRVFRLFVLETILLSAVGGPIGLLMGWLSNEFLGTHGLDLSRYATSLKEIGYDTVFYPVLSDLYYPLLMLVVIFTALVGSLYPAFRAVQLKPVEALRKI